MKAVNLGVLLSIRKIGHRNYTGTLMVDGKAVYETTKSDTYERAAADVKGHLSRMLSEMGGLLE